MVSQQVRQSGFTGVQRAAAAALVCGAMLALPVPALAAAAQGAQSPSAPLVTVAAQAGGGARSSGFDGVVEAVRQTTIAAQVAGAVVQLDVKVGDRVKAGQVLLRLDARSADQGVAASDAQVQAARASLAVAQRDFERQKLLHDKNFISQAALDRAEAEFKATQAQVNAQAAQAGVARTQTGFNVVRAPYNAVVSEVPVALGDMAMPGRPLVSLYDPSVLRISAAVPQSVAGALPAALLADGAALGAALRAELPGLPTTPGQPQPGQTGPQGPGFAPSRAQLLPTVDAATHTVLLRADLPAGLAGAAPGMFARLWLPMNGSGGSAGPVASGGSSGTAAADAATGTSPSVPRQAVVRRAELTALYVLNAEGKPLLRQVRLGRVDGDRVEVLSGLSAGERVAIDPQAAARVR